MFHCIDIPQLTKIPMVDVRDSTAESLTVLFDRWQQNIDVGNTEPDHYTVQYRVKGTETWKDGPSVGNKGAIQQRVKVTGLELNTFYIFRVVPVLIEPKADMETDIPESRLSRTKCKGTIFLLL